MKLLKNKDGFTLVESIVTMAVLLIIMSAVYQFFMASNSYNTALNEVNDAQDHINTVLYTIRTEVADAYKAEVFDRPSDFDPNAYDFAEGYIYLISNPYSGYTKYYKEGGALKSAPVGTFADEAELANLKNSDISAYNKAIEEAKYKINIKFSTSGAGTLEAVAEIKHYDSAEADPAIHLVSSKIALRSTVNAGVGNSIRFKTGVE